MARVLLAPVLDQYLFGAWIVVPLTAKRERRPLTTQPSVVGPGGVGQCHPTVAVRPAPEDVVVGVEHVHEEPVRCRR